MLAASAALARELTADDGRGETAVIARPRIAGVELPPGRAPLKRAAAISTAETVFALVVRASGSRPVALTCAEPVMDTSEPRGSWVVEAVFSAARGRVLVAVEEERACF